jgi:hypothetical protein
MLRGNFGQREPKWFRALAKLASSLIAVYDADRLPNLSVGRGNGGRSRKIGSMSLFAPDIQKGSGT